MKAGLCLARLQYGNVRLRPDYEFQVRDQTGNKLCVGAQRLAEGFAPAIEFNVALAQ